MRNYRSVLNGVMLAVVFWAMSIMAWSATPTIQFTFVPPYGSTSLIKGKATNVVFANYLVALYIKVGDGWWTKPSTASPTVAIATDGTWQANVFTGGYDQYATGFAAFLVPTTATIPASAGLPNLPIVTQAIASAQITNGPAQKSLSFAGYNWNIKRRDFPYDPGQNFWSDDANDIWVDSVGMHLTVKKVGGVWWCTEATLNQHLGYGTYYIQVHGRLDNLDPKLIAAPFFTYDLNPVTGHRELDFEFAKWNSATDGTNAQFVSQPIPNYPWGSDSHGVRYTISQTDAACDLTLIMNWSFGRVEFRAYYGKWLNTTPPETSLAKAWVYHGADVAMPGEEYVHCNYWCMDSTGPTDGQNREYVITGFKFSPMVGQPKSTFIQFKEQPSPISTNLTRYCILGSYPDADSVTVNGAVMTGVKFSYLVFLTTGSNNFTVTAKSGTTVLETVTKTIIYNPNLTINDNLLYVRAIPSTQDCYVIDLDGKYLLGYDSIQIHQTNYPATDPTGKYRLSTASSWANSTISIRTIATGVVNSIGGLFDYAVQQIAFPGNERALVGAYGNSYYGGGGIYTVDLKNTAIKSTLSQYGVSSVILGRNGSVYSTSINGVEEFSMGGDDLLFQRNYLLDIAGYGYSTGPDLAFRGAIIPTTVSVWTAYQ